MRKATSVPNIANQQANNVSDCPSAKIWMTFVALLIESELIFIVIV